VPRSASSAARLLLLAALLAALATCLIWDTCRDVIRIGLLQAMHYYYNRQCNVTRGNASALREI
jgi:hypothetical protein